MKPAYKPHQVITIHRDGSVSYFSVNRQQWDRVSAYALTNRHDDYSTLPESDRVRISREAFRGR